MVTTRFHKVLVLMIAAFALAAQVYLATPQGEVAVEPVPMLLAGDNSPHIGG
jgi:hypothetical protein